MAPKAIPDRWIPYKACGKVIEGTRIICFKVPLAKAVQIGNKDIKEIWDIKALLEKIPGLGAVIDLTNTARYYNPRDLQAEGILHQKILMPGRIIPPEDKVQQFMDTVDEFLGKNCDFLIGVHCTHGLNRTGYMVCRYMRDRLHINAKTALKRFEAARGYEIERANYVADLLGEPSLPADTGNNTVPKSFNSNWSTDDRGNQNNGARKNTRWDNTGDRGGQTWRSNGDRGNASHNSNWRSTDRRDSYSASNKSNSGSERQARDSESSPKWSYDYRYDY